MSVSYSIDNMGDHLCVTVQGVISKKDDALEFGISFRQKAEELGLKRILIDCRQARIELSYFESVQLAKHIESSGFIFQGNRIAHLIAPEQVRLFADYKTPAANRGFFFEFFTDQDEALAWLLKD